MSYGLRLDPFYEIFPGLFNSGEHLRDGEFQNLDPLNQDKTSISLRHLSDYSPCFLLNSKGTKWYENE